MRFWCSVSDRCSGKIGEGEVPPACSSCVYTLCLEQREPCHIRHDWCGFMRIVRAYLHEALVGGPTRAGRFCVAIICPARSAAALLPSGHAASQRTTSQEFPPPLPVMKSVYISANDSPRRRGLPDTTPNVFLTITHHLWAASRFGLRGEINAAQKTSCLCHPRTVPNR